jgi:hypothetical protein
VLPETKYARLRRLASPTRCSGRTTEPGDDPGSFGHMDIVWEDPAAAALILANTTARWVAADNYPIGIPRQVAEALIAGVEQA